MSQFTEQLFKNLVDFLPIIPSIPDSALDTVLLHKMKESCDAKTVDDFGWLFIAEIRHYLQVNKKIK